MGFMTLEDFRQEVNMVLGEHAQNENGRLNIWINRAYHEAAARSIFEALTEKADIPTVVDQQAYALPATAISVISISDLTNKRRIMRTALRNFDLQRQTDKGKPKLWAQRGTSFLLWPIPNKVTTLQVTFVKEPAVLATPTDVTILPARWDHFILLLAQRNAWLTFRESERATLAHQAAGTYLNDIFEENELDMGQPTMGVRLANSWEELTRMDYEFPE